MKTHYAVVEEGQVLGSRSSASRHPGGSGKFGIYTHAVVTKGDLGGWGVTSWHGSYELAASALRTWKNTLGGRYEMRVLPVVVTPRRMK
jgi:hypothetical protein